MPVAEFPHKGVRIDGPVVECHRQRGHAHALRGREYRCGHVFRRHLQFHHLDTVAGLVIGVHVAAQRLRQAVVLDEGKLVGVVVAERACDAVGQDHLDQAGGLVVGVTCFAAIPIRHRQQAVGSVVAIRHLLVIGVGEAGAVAGTVVAVLYRLQQRIRDYGKAVNGVVAVTGQPREVAHREPVAHGVVSEADSFVGARDRRQAVQVVVDVAGLRLIRVHHARQIAHGVVVVLRHIAQRVGSLHHAVEGVVAVGEAVAQRVGGGNQVAHGVVAELIDHVGFRVLRPAADVILRHLGEPVEGVILVARLHAFGVRHAHLVAHRVVEVAGGAIERVRDADHAVQRVVDKRGLMPQRVNDGGVVADSVIAVLRRVTQRVGLADEAVEGIVSHLRGRSVGIGYLQQVAHGVVGETGGLV